MHKFNTNGDGPASSKAMAMFLTPEEVDHNRKYFDKYEWAHVKRIKCELEEIKKYKTVVREDMLKQNEKTAFVSSKYVSILEPKPCASHIYCSVCRAKFTDYFEHVNSDHHSLMTRLDVDIYG